MQVTTNKSASSNQLIDALKRVNWNNFRLPEASIKSCGIWSIPEIDKFSGLKYFDHLL